MTTLSVDLIAERELLLCSIDNSITKDFLVKLSRLDNSRLLCCTMFREGIGQEELFLLFFFSLCVTTKIRLHYGLCFVER